MFTKLHQSIGMALIIALAPIMLAATPVAAAAPEVIAPPKPTYTFDTAGGPVAGTVQIEAKGSNWFKFKYTYDNTKTEERNADGNHNSEPTQAFVNLKMAVANCVSFDVWTQDRLQTPQHNGQDKDAKNDKITPVGRGTPYSKGSVQVDGKQQDVSDAQMLTWAGSAATSDTYYVVVKNRTDAACSYSLSISGQDVSF